MKNLQKFFLALIAFVVLMTSCNHKKEDDPAPAPSAPTGSKTHVYKMASTSSTAFYKEFTYDSQNRVWKIDLGDADGEYFYDATGRLEKYVMTPTDGSETMETDLIYTSGNTIDKIEISIVSMNTKVLISTANFEYSVDQLSKITYYGFDEDQNPVQIKVTEYTHDAQGNVTKETNTSDDGTETIVSSYDNKKSPWATVITRTWDPLFGAISPSNELSHTYTDVTGTVDNSESYTATYSYNSELLPVTATYTSLDGDKEDYTIDYK
jgi:hypothetical protein